jgi:adenylate cyclase
LSFLPIYSYFLQQKKIIEQNRVFERFVPKEFIHILGISEITHTQLGNQIEKELTILFSDIRAYTTLSEQMSPEENITFINNYLGTIAPIVKKHGGFIDKYIGDAIMAIFPNHPKDAINASLEMLATLEEFNHHSMMQPIEIGIGIHTGKTMLGIVGEQERYQGTVISDSVNLASRLEGLTKNYRYPLLFSHSTTQQIKNHFSVTYIDKLKVKGKTKETNIYTLASFKNS